MLGTADARSDPKIEPCPHMRSWLSALCDGSLRGIARWYTRFHVSHCPRCGKALEALRALRDRLRNLAGFSSDAAAVISDARKDAVRAELDRIDSNA